MGWAGLFLILWHVGRHEHDGKHDGPGPAQHGHVTARPDPKKHERKEKTNLNLGWKETKQHAEEYTCVFPVLAHMSGQWNGHPGRQAGQRQAAKTARQRAARGYVPDQQILQEPPCLQLLLFFLVHLPVPIIGTAAPANIPSPLSDHDTHDTPCRALDARSHASLHSR